jgi:hypothetical protein
VSGGLDLLVGGTVGEWALRNVSPALVRQVVSVDGALVALALALGHEVFAGDPHEAAFAPAPAALSLDFPLVLRPALIARYDGAIWNLHGGLLPYGRGLHPVFWALWEGTPAGATLHELTIRVHGGPVVEQREVAVLSSDTGARLHERVQAAERELFTRWTPQLAAGRRPAATPQRGADGTYHTLAEFEFLRDEGHYEVPRAERKRLERCLAFSQAQQSPSVRR